MCSVHMWEEGYKGWNLDADDSHFSFLSDGLPVELSYALDESEEGGIAVNLLPVLLASRNNASSKEKSDR